MSRVAQVSALVALVMLLVVGVGCRQAATPPATGEQAQAPAAGPGTAAPNRVDAWINVSSGCQQATVDLLKKLAQQYAGKIDVTVTDFGTPEGADKWQMAGLHCMTIQFNGDYAITFPQGGQDHTVVFQMPPGLLWEHADLVSAFEALNSGSLRKATQDDIDRLTAPIKVDLHARAQATTQGGTQCGQLVVGDSVIASLYGSQGKLAPLARAGAAKKAIDKWTAEPVSPADLSIAKGPDGWGVYGNETLILLVTPADVRGNGAMGEPEAVAKLWLASLRKAVISAVNAARKAHKAAPAGPSSAPSAQPSSK